MVRHLSIYFIFITTLFIQASGNDYFSNVYATKKVVNDKSFIHDEKHNRFIEISRSSLLTGGNSQIRISSDITFQSGKILSFPYQIEDVIAIDDNHFLIAAGGQHARLLYIESSGKIVAVDSVSFSKTRGIMHFIGKHRTPAFIRQDDNIFSIRISNEAINSSLVAEQVLAVQGFDTGLHCIVRSGGGLVLRTMDQNSDINSETPFSPMGSTYRILSTSRSILILSTATGENTNAFLLDRKTGKQEMLFFPGPPSLTALWEQDGKPVLSWLSEDEQGIKTVSIQQQGKQTTTLALPQIFTDALACSLLNSHVYYIFNDGMCEIDPENLSLRAASTMPLMRVFTGGSPILVNLKDEYIVSSNGAYMFLTKTNDPFWWLRQFLSTSGSFVIPIAIGFLLFIFYRRYTLQKRFLEAGLELSGMGIIIYLDSEGRLSKVNSTARSVLQITTDIPLLRPIRYYVSKSHLSELLTFIETALIDRKPMQSNITIGEGDRIKEYIFGVTPLFGFAGSFAGCILSGIDITEELEKKRLTNWAQLAHDMQTNLSIILLNAQQLQIVDEKNITRQKKILSQITLLMQRVRDIVTVGREEEITLSPNDALVICRNVIQEFDEQLFPHASLSYGGKPVLFMCDPIKLTRGLRNAVENGMRALQNQNGSVDLSCTYDDQFVYFRVKDSGIGMDDHTRTNMMQPYFTTKKSQGGYGIGTMVMQKVAELHKGRIEIVSEPGKGSVITFILPLITQQHNA